MDPNQNINQNYSMPPQDSGNSGIKAGLIVGAAIFFIVIILILFSAVAFLALKSAKSKSVSQDSGSYNYPAKIRTEPNGLTKISTKRGSIDLYANQSLPGNEWENNVNSEADGDYQYYNSKYDCGISFFIVSSDAFYSPESYNQANIDAVINADMKYNDVSSTIDSQQDIDDLEVKKFNSNSADGYSLKRRQYSGVYHDGVKYKLRTAAVTNNNEAISIVDECADSSPQNVRDEVDGFLSELKLQLN